MAFGHYPGALAYDRMVGPKEKALVFSLFLTGKYDSLDGTN